MKSSKVLPNPNSEINILKNTVQGAITKLNNYLIAYEQSHRYKLEWKKGDGQIMHPVEQKTVTNYCRMDLFIEEADGNIIMIYGGNYPVDVGISQIRINEAEIQAYKDLFIHAIGHLISVQHSMFLKGEAEQIAQEQQLIEDEKNAIDQAMNKPKITL